MSDEAHFRIGDYVNKQNCQEELFYKASRSSTPNLSGGVIDLIFSKTGGATVTVNGYRYQAMNKNFV